MKVPLNEGVTKRAVPSTPSLWSRRPLPEERLAAKEETLWNLRDRVRKEKKSTAAGMENK